MSVEAFLEKMTKIQKSILEFIENEDDEEENFLILVEFFTELKISEDPIILKSVLHIILNISNNHYRSHNFFGKLERILMHFSVKIKKKFSQQNIFNIFQSNKKILLFLNKNKFIKIDEFLTIILTNNKYKNRKYLQYFYPELKKFINNVLDQQIKKEIPENFEEMREIGENENYICELIRKDMIEDFITYVNRNKLELDLTVDDSIFETNPLLILKKPSLIEYSAFFGSFQIFKYLFYNGVEISSDLIIYAIHSQNPELINFFKENKRIQEKAKIDKKALFESVKCHHNDIVNYIQYNFLQNAENDIFFQCLKSHNYAYMQKELVNKSVFYFLCKFDYISLVEIVMNQIDIDINGRIILII